MLMKYQDGQFYPDLYMCMPLFLYDLMVVLSIAYPPWYSRLENNLNIFIA